MDRTVATIERKEQRRLQIEKKREEERLRLYGEIPTTERFIKLKHRPDNCKRCELLFEYAGQGNGEWCDECLNELGIL